MAIALVTDRGNELLAAATTAAQFEVNSFKLGSRASAQGYTAQSSDTDVSGEIYSSLNDVLSTIRYTTSAEGFITFTLSLDHSLGPFDIGNVGLFTADGTLFAIHSRPTQLTKTATDTDAGIVGDRTVIRMVVRVSGASNKINLTTMTPEDTSIPEVGLEDRLPNARTTNFNTYIVRNRQSGAGKPQMFVSDGQVWSEIGTPAGQATETELGSVRRATNTEAIVASDTQKYMTPRTVREVSSTTRAVFASDTAQDLADRVAGRSTRRLRISSSPWTAHDRYLIQSAESPGGVLQSHMHIGTTLTTGTVIRLAAGTMTIGSPDTFTLQGGARTAWPLRIWGLDDV